MTAQDYHFLTYDPKRNEPVHFTLETLGRESESFYAEQIEGNNIEMNHRCQTCALVTDVGFKCPTLMQMSRGYAAEFVANGNGCIKDYVPGGG